MNDVSQQTVSDKIAAQVEMRRAGRRKRVHHGGALCSKCLARPPIANNRYCRECHNAAALASYHRKKGIALTVEAAVLDRSAVLSERPELA